MIILQGNNLFKNYGVDNIFDNVSIVISGKDKAGLVGPNGVGKSTLLECLVGQEELDNGTISLAKNIKIGYLPQSTSIADVDRLLLDYIMDEFEDLIKVRYEVNELQKKMSNPDIYNNPKNLEKTMNSYSSLVEKYEREGGYSFESKAKGVLFGLGFKEDDLARSLITFSGGQKTRIAMAKVLLRDPELLILDEPTNYLDLNAVEWLEGYLTNYTGAVLLVSHDRYFLDQVTNKTLEMSSKGIKSFSGNYSRYLRLKKEQEESHKKAYDKQQEYIRNQEEYILKYKAGIKSKQARGRQSILNRLDRIDKPTSPGKKVNLKFNIDESTGEKVLEIEKLDFGYSENKLFDDLEFSLYKEEKVALIGDNGTGKTTLFKIIMGEISAYGEVRFGSRVKCAYFSQEHEDLNGQNTVLEEAWISREMTLNDVRFVLGKFLFTGDSVDKKVSVLSGGEKSRLMLAKLFLQNANLLILDEPTNHLDVATREALEEALEDFSGSILFISHDRYFINRLADRIIELEDKKLKNYLGDFDYYKWKKRDMQLDAAQKKPTEIKKIKAMKKTKEVKVKKPSINEVENEIEELEKQLEAISNILGTDKTYSNHQEVVDYTEKYKEIEQKLQNLYVSWEDMVGD